MTFAATESAHGGAPAPYNAPHEHLADLLLRQAWLLKRQLARGQLREPTDILGFAAISEQEVQRLLDEATQAEPSRADLRLIDRTLRQLELRIERRVELSRMEGTRLPIVELAERFGLTPHEINLLFTCLAVELDRRFERVYGFLHDDMSRRLASPGLAISLLCDDFDEQLSARASLAPQAPLRRYRLLEVLEDGAAAPWTSRPMRIDERVVAFLVGDDTMDARLGRHTVLHEVLDEASSALLSSGDRAELLQRLEHLATSGLAHGRPLVYLHGGHHAAADLLARSAAARLGIPLLSLDAELLADVDTEFEHVLFLAFRESVLRQAAIHLRHADRALEPPHGASRYRTLLRYVEDMGGVVFASGERPWSWPVPAEPVMLRLAEVRSDSVEDQLHAWRSASGGAFHDGELHRLISLHPMPVTAIHDVWRMSHAIGARAEGGMPTLEEVQQACRVFSGTPASTLARRVEPKHRWKDLVLPVTQREQLEAICSQARHSSIVYGSWRFQGKLSLGRGLNALFTGEPGTGKTMAAEVIATELGLEILKIDLSQIISKYIGETEKNLRQLFDQAASANAILFFDEADAVLGKRSDVKDAHDRYANTETAYLLQKMEEYPGITILATNLSQNMDQAFTRRMRFIVDFPFPEEADRLRIWETIWPSDVPLGEDVDFAVLARQFRLSGGSIRNIALAAAFLAAEQSQSVGMRHLMLATKREMRKMGRLVNEEEYRRYG